MEEGTRDQKKEERRERGGGGEREGGGKGPIQGPVQKCSLVETILYKQGTETLLLLSMCLLSFPSANKGAWGVD